MVMSDFLFTIFAPLYNGRNTIDRVFQSLMNSTYRNFEWILVNDGSTDDSNEIVLKLIQDVDWDITYINWDKNKGKHIAWNNAAKIAKGDIFITLDCDDALVSNALEFLNEHWNKYYDDRTIYGIDTLCIDPNTNAICGSLFPYDNIKSNYGELYNKYKVWGDKLNSFRTEYMKKFPFPEIDANYYTECYLLYSLGEHYYSIGVNRVLRHYYQELNSITHTKKERINTVYMIIHYQKWHIPKVAMSLLKENPRELCRCIKELVLMQIKYRIMRFFKISEITYKFNLFF